jgi:hypothetical protein
LAVAVEGYLASLPECDWRALCARVRPPDEPPLKATGMNVEAP